MLREKRLHAEKLPCLPHPHSFPSLRIAMYSRPVQAERHESCFNASFFCLTPRHRRYKKMEDAADDPAGPSSSKMQLGDAVVNGADGAKPKRSRSRRAGKGREDGEGSIKETAMPMPATATPTTRAMGKTHAAAASSPDGNNGHGVYVPPSDAVRAYARAPPPSKITTVGCAIPVAAAFELVQHGLPQVY